MHISTALKIILAIVLIVFILTLILIAYCCYRKISKNRKGKGKTSSLPFSKENGSGLGINGIGGGNAYRLGANGQETGLAGGPNGREKESGAGYESFRESGSAYDAYRGEARKSFQLEQERIKAGLVGPVVKP
jgi:cbb3-type cytochrome oxidase subunit 3